VTAIDNQLAVELPAGGRLHLQTAEEVELFEESRDRYIHDYGLEAQNDLTLLGAVLTQQLVMFRAQQRMTGMEPEFDHNGLPTGVYKQTTLKAADMSAAQNMIVKAAGEIRELEKALALDKKTRESGGQHTVASYVSTLKEAARKYGLHISKRVMAYEKFAMELRWRIRLLNNGDAEDRAYHNLSPSTVLEWCENELKALEEADQRYAKEIGAIYVGKVR
jgi:hypothetical protein